ncbi:FAD-dependent oxidoreductase [Leucobacter zeae]|nr:FAD-dependent oxidoreductase [Leucobacter zeae]
MQRSPHSFEAPESLWRRTGPSIPADDAPGGAADAVVVGAGLTGLTTAVLLARAGLGVVVLEARETGAVTTGGTTGKLSLLQGTRFSEIRERAGDAVVQAYATANLEGQAWLARELEHRGAPAERRQAWTYAEDGTGMRSLERELEAATIAGVAGIALTNTDLPFPTAGALVLDGQLLLHPMRVLAVLAEELRERGGRLVERSRVRRVERRGGRVDVSGAFGTVVADTCVLATGTPILDRGMFFARLEPEREFVAAYRLLESSPPSGMYLSVDAPTRSLRPASDAHGEELLLVGGAGHTTGRATDPVGELRGIEAWTTQHFGGAARQCWWAAQDYRSHNRLPYAGPLAGGGGRIFTATGYAKWGMSNAVAAALTIAADVLDGDLRWAEELRSFHASGETLRETVAANASVAARLVVDRVAAAIPDRAASRADGREPEVLAGPEPDHARDPEEGAGRIEGGGGTPVAASRVDGRVCRVSGICTHLGGVLRWNDAERSWDCPLHGSRFDPDGSVLEGPAVDDLEPRQPAESGSDSK